MSVDVKGDVGSPIYHQIALDIAVKIVNGTFPRDERLRGRSVLASTYNVSPETIRRALFLLQDVDIVEIVPSVGVQIRSVEKAVEFVDNFRNIQSLTQLKNQINQLIGEINQKNQELQSTIHSLIEYNDQYKILNPYMPFELEVHKGGSVVGRTISQVNFWHNTRTTIVGIKRQSQTILSPGPHLEFQAGDIIALVGDEESYNLAKAFISSK